MADSGSTVIIAVNQILKIELPGDAASGNDWRKMSYDDEVVKRKGKNGGQSNYMLSDGASGSPGVYYFQFFGYAPGACKLYMEYGNKYKMGKEALKTFEIDIVVIPE